MKNSLIILLILFLATKAYPQSWIDAALREIEQNNPSQKGM